jgi:hypothetical protein
MLHRVKKLQLGTVNCCCCLKADGRKAEAPIHREFDGTDTIEKVTEGLPAFRTKAGRLESRMSPKLNMPPNTAQSCSKYSGDSQRLFERVFFLSDGWSKEI